MQLNNVQRIDDLSPKMRDMISRTKRDRADQAMEILSKGGLGYILQEIADRYGEGVREISEHSDELSFIANQLSFLEEEAKKNPHLPIAATTELIYLKGLIDYISVEHGKQQLELGRATLGIPGIMLRTRGSVNIILGSNDEEDMRSALGK